jgi:hypothetical protein
MQSVKMIQPGDNAEKRVGRGKVIVSDLKSMLKKVDVPRETAMDAGIRFVRRRSGDGFDYFFVNRSDKVFDGWMTLGKPAQSGILMDPLLENRTGQAAIRGYDDAAQVYLQLRPAESIILRTFATKTNAPAWQYTQKQGSVKQIEGTWDVDFIKGGPALPQDYQTTQLASWTDRDDEEAKRFFGTARYTIEFDAPAQQADAWLLDLGRVHESARVTLNDVYLGSLWAEPFQLQIEPARLKPGRNTLEIEVTNLAANRIRDLDWRGVNWKYFYDINVVNVNYRPFDASDWPLFDSGLLGPVQLQPLKVLSP